MSIDDDVFDVTSTLKEKGTLEGVKEFDRIVDYIRELELSEEKFRNRYFTLKKAFIAIKEIFEEVD